MLSDNYLREVIDEAEAETNRLEQRAIAKLYQRGDMANFDGDGQRAIEARVRKLLAEA